MHARGCRWDLPPDGTRLEFNASAVQLLGEWGNGTDKAAEWARTQLRLVLGWEHMASGASYACVAILGLGRAHSGLWTRCVWRIQATATSSAPAALHVLLTIVCRPELPRGARESRRAARLRPGERGRPPQQRRCRAAAKDPLLRQECNNNITVPLASPYTDSYLFLRQECGGNPKSKPKPHSDPNPTPTPTPNPNPNLTLRQECGGPIGR